MIPFEDTLLPFYCSNKSCKAKIEKFNFIASANMMGYILLANEDNIIVGLNCPNCLNTTIYFFDSDVIPKLLGLMPEHKYYVPFFFPESLRNDEKEAKSKFEILQNILRADETFIERPSLEHTEEELKAFLYPDWFVKKCKVSFSKNEIENILRHENQKQIKIFPRIVNQHSLYLSTDRILYAFRGPDDEPEYVEGEMRVLMINEHLIRMMNRCTYFVDNRKLFSDEEAKDISTTYRLAMDYPDNFFDSIHRLIDDYIELRSDFNFQGRYLKEYLYKYIMKFYHIDGYSESDQRVRDKMEYEDIFGKTVKSINMLHDNVEIITEPEILERWGKGKAVLKRVIANGDLSAYGANGLIIDISRQEIFDGKFDSSDLVFLKSDLREIETRMPWLKNINKITNEQHNSLDTDPPSTQQFEMKPKESNHTQKPPLTHREKVYSECIMIAEKVWKDAQKKGDAIPGPGEIAKRPEIVKIAKHMNGKQMAKGTIQKKLSPIGKKYGADNAGTRKGTKKRSKKSSSSQ